MLLYTALKILRLLYFYNVNIYGCKNTIMFVILRFYYTGVNITRCLYKYIVVIHDRKNTIMVLLL